MSKGSIYGIISGLMLLICLLQYRSPSLLTGVAAFIGLIMAYMMSHENNKEHKMRRIQEQKRQQELNELKRQEQLKQKHILEIKEMEQKRQEQAKIEQARPSEFWYCSQCGHHNPGKSNFCPMCGNKR